MLSGTMEILSKGMRCLVDQMGTVDAELFISTVIREKFDYTKWQREYFDAKTPDEIIRDAASFEESHPFPHPEREMSITPTKHSLDGA